MRLAELINTVEEEWNEEVRTSKADPLTAAAAERQTQIQQYEVLRSGAIQSILQEGGFPAGPVPLQVTIVLVIAFRLGRRVQWKIDHPDEVSTLGALA